MGDISTNFSRYEAVCKCGCGFFHKDELLLKRLEKMRQLLDNKPMHINSWCRCGPYNTLVGGNKNSEHVDGQAADIRVGNSAERFLTVIAAWMAGFRRIGVADGFVHVDTDTNKPQKVLWLYK